MTKKEKLAYSIAQRVSSSVQEQAKIGEQILNGDAKGLMSWYADRINQENQYNQESGSLVMISIMRDCHNSDIMERAEEGFEFASDAIPFELSHPQDYLNAAKELFDQYEIHVNHANLKEAFGIAQAHYIAEHATAKYHIDGELAQEAPDMKDVIYDVDVKAMMTELSRELYHGNGNKLYNMLGQEDLSDLRYMCSRGVINELSSSMRIQFDAEQTWGHMDKYEEIGVLHMPYEGMDGFNPEQPFAIYREMSEEDKDMLYALDLSNDEINALIERGDLANPGSANGFVYYMEAREVEENSIERETDEPELVAPGGF